LSNLRRPRGIKLQFKLSWGESTFVKGVGFTFGLDATTEDQGIVRIFVKGVGFTFGLDETMKDQGILNWISEELLSKE